ncbi:MAG TPA: polysaccharide deacetylase family protein [Niabella sp.]|nr:polysaccharide deacetylase family protein [Candidatus Woesebacteria bacterium]HUN02561.1 polysaccharide deacetylase family protein [Niabella sp.]
MNQNGHFIISLDFELIWGVFDLKDINAYRKNIKAVHKVIPQLLEIFNRYNISATFATVGFLFHRDKEDFLSNIPTKTPNYINKKLSPYTNEFNKLGANHHSDPYHYGAHLIDLIRSYPNHEIASHTFSHFYCLEEGQTPEDFEEDLITAKKTALLNNIELKSLIFPRNQFNTQYLRICKTHGIESVRGNEKSWIYHVSSGKKNYFQRALKLLDTYLNITGHNCHVIKNSDKELPLNIPSSRFLRPYSSKLSFLEFLKLKRIKKGMSYAAKNNQIYHLWWHPHNFGMNTKENFDTLNKILDHYSQLNQKYNFTSLTMSELTEKLS